jgi:hydroxymethylbilane synthase
MRLKLASRKSDLARWQAHKVARALEALPEKPRVEFQFKSSFGDQNLDIPLAGMGARGVFTEDFYEDLKEGRCDLVVHSWKDLPVDERSGTKISMTLPRADVRDALFIPEDVWQKALKTKKLTVFTSSPRRVYNLAPVLPKLLPGRLEIEFKNIRGNVPTRLKKMHEGKGALILAKAGLDRLLEAEAENFTEESVRRLIQDCRFLVLPISLNPPAPAQGALAIEISATNETMNSLSARLNDETTYNCVQEERKILSGYGGGCHQKIGVARLLKPYGMVKSLRGQTDAGEILQEWKIENFTPWSKAQSADKIFPLKAKDNSWFERKPLKGDFDFSAVDGLFVARADALPAKVKPKPEQIVWTAGVQTWIKLAERGVFVNGCLDGLGEGEELGIERICGGRKELVKLTHGGGDKSSQFNAATYELIPKKETPDLKGKTHFFWMSRTSFQRAAAEFPEEIRTGHHACGPGRTYEFLKSAGLSRPVKVFIGLEQFLDETMP